MKTKAKVKLSKYRACQNQLHVLADENGLLRQVNQMLYDDLLRLDPDSEHRQRGVPRLRLSQYQG